MASFKSKVIGLIELEPSHTAARNSSFSALSELPDWMKRRDAKPRPIPATVQLEADLGALMSQLDKELKSLDSRLTRTIAAAEL